MTDSGETKVIATSMLVTQTKTIQLIKYCIIIRRSTSFTALLSTIK